MLAALPALFPPDVPKDAPGAPECRAVREAENDGADPIAIAGSAALATPPLEPPLKLPAAPVEEAPVVPPHVA